MLEQLEAQLRRQAADLAATEGDVMVFNLAEALQGEPGEPRLGSHERERQALWDKMNRRVNENGGDPSARGATEAETAGGTVDSPAVVDRKRSDGSREGNDDGPMKPTGLCPPRG